jgi:hypothetical protein
MNVYLPVHKAEFEKLIEDSKPVIQDLLDQEYEAYTRMYFVILYD